MKSKQQPPTTVYESLQLLKNAIAEFHDYQNMMTAYERGVIIKDLENSTQKIIEQYFGLSVDLLLEDAIKKHIEVYHKNEHE